MANQLLQNKAINGFIWSFLELMSRQGIQLIMQIILARLLLPKHFGLIGMIIIFIEISNAFVNSGLDQALIREKNITQKDYSTVFFFNLFISIIIYIMIFVLSPTIASFYNEPILVDILRALMIIIIINAFCIVQRVILIRNLNFKTQTKISIISNLVSGIIAILLATFGFGVWSLVFQRILMHLFESILMFFSIKWLPSLAFSKSHLTKYYKFGYKLLLSSLIDTTYKNIYLVIVGKLYPANQLGYLTNATKLRDVSSQSISQAIQKVTYPLLSKIQENDSELTNNYKNIIKLTSFVFFPFIIGIAAIAPNLIPFLLGDKWEPAVIYFQLLCIASMLYPIHALNLNVLKVKNRSDLFLRLEIIKKIILTILIFLAVIFGSSIESLLFAFIIQSFIALIVNTFYSGKEISYPLIAQIKDMLPSFIISIVMGLLIYIFIREITNVTFINLLLQIITGIIVYISLAFALKIRELRDIYILLKDLLNRIK